MTPSVLSPAQLRMSKMSRLKSVMGFINYAFINQVITFRESDMAVGFINYALHRMGRRHTRHWRKAVEQAAVDDWLRPL
jgi:hypothetical protein